MSSRTKDGTIVLTRDTSSGRVHKRVWIGEHLASLEVDNLDEAGDFEILPSIEDVDPDALCRRCFDAPMLPEASRRSTTF